MKLKQEQINNAAQAFYKAMPSVAIAGIYDACPGIIAAAPHLQVPWEELTDEEWGKFIVHAPRNLNGRLDAARESLNALIMALNLLRIPNPIDPRIEKIIRVIDKRDCPTAEKMADRIIAALDAKDGQ